MVTETLKFEFASTEIPKHTSYQKILLTGFLLLKNFLRDRFKFSNLTLSVIDMKLSQAMQFVARHILKLKTTARTNNFFFLLDLKP